MVQLCINPLPHELAENKEEFRLVWLDSNIDDSINSTKIQLLLLKRNPSAQFFTDHERCIDILNVITDEKVLLIISDSLSQLILPKIHDFRCIYSIFIFCADRQCDESLKNAHQKVIGIFSEQDKLLNSINETIDFLVKQTIGFSIFNQHQKSSKILSRESASFLWHQMVLYVLQQIPQDEQSKSDLLDKCREYYRLDEDELQKIEEFRKYYCPEKATEWYTKESFLHKILNKALRTEDIELIYSFRFFIIDICTEIAKEHVKLRQAGSFKTYRGYQISIEELQHWKNNVGSIMSINSFFSTSRDIDVAIAFTHKRVLPNTMESVLLEIEIDSSLKYVTCADISQISYYIFEQEVIFNLNSVFKIISIDFDSHLKLWKIYLKTTDEGMDNVEQHLRYIKEEMEESSSMYYFGLLLLNELGEIQQAEKYFQTLLEILPLNHPDIPSIYDGIGRVHFERNELDLALGNYEIAYKMRQQNLPPNHSLLANSIYNIANIKREKGEFDHALEFYQQALVIEAKNVQDYNLKKSIIIQNIGNTFTAKDDLDNALIYLSDALDMLKRIVPTNHQNIATCIGDIGFVYEKKNDFQKALDYYKNEHDIDQQYLPPDHPHLSTDLAKIAFTYEKCDQFDKALEFCQNQFNLQQDMLGDNNARIAKTLMTLGILLEKEHLNKSLPYYKKALSLLRRSTKIDYRTIAKCLTTIGRFYGIYKSFDIALRYLVEAVYWHRRHLSPDSIDVAHVYELIGLNYWKINKHSEALGYFNDSLTIYQNFYDPDHNCVKRMEGHLNKLLNEQQAITDKTPQIEETKNDVQPSIITIVTDTHKSDVEESPPVLVESKRTPPIVNEMDIKCELDTPLKPKNCPQCVIL